MRYEIWDMRYEIFTLSHSHTLTLVKGCFYLFPDTYKLVILSNINLYDKMES